MTLCPQSGGGMPWKERHVMDERLRFVARLLEGEKMAPLCAEQLVTDRGLPARGVRLRPRDPFFRDRVVFLGEPRHLVVRNHRLIVILEVGRWASLHQSETADEIDGGLRRGVAESESDRDEFEILPTEIRALLHHRKERKRRFAVGGSLQPFGQFERELVKESRDVLITEVRASDATTRLCKQRIGHRAHVLDDEAPDASSGAGHAETATVQQVLPAPGTAQHGQRVEQAGFETSVPLKIVDQLLLERGNRGGVAGLTKPVDSSERDRWIGTSPQPQIYRL